MLEALIFLAAAVICVPLAKRLGLGAVLGYLIAGAAIGPWGLRLIDDTESTKNLAELGVVLMLFVIGLELDPRRFLAMRGVVFGGGALQLAASGAVLGVALCLVGLTWQASLIGGLSLALSSTAIAMQALTERNELDTPTGRTSFAILLFQDIAAIPLIALVPFVGEATGASGQPLWMRVGMAVAAVAGVVVIGRYLTAPLLRLIAKTELREVFTAFALLLVIGIAELMSLAGVSMALGAFLAGVLLAGSEFRHALEGDIEPFKGLLLGLFFISVGMTIDFGLLSSQPGTVALLLAGFLLLKITSLWAVAQLIDICRQRWLFAFLLSQGGEFAFVVFQTAREARVFTSQWEALLTITVALSMATTPLFLLAHDRFIASRARREDERPADAIDAESPIIIAGFGRFGQIVGRLLLASGIRPVVLDHDPDQVDSLRKFGYRVFYGDATRLDLLEAAGARKARLLVNAIDDVESSLALVDRVRAHFPQLDIVSRARNVSHYFELRIRGVQVAERETFESALKAGRATLEKLGVDRFRAKELADAFRRHNIASVDATLPFYQDEARRMSIAKQGREELEKQFARDRERFEREHGTRGWTGKR
ncbi:MAG TPA: glutathione-regulated potassium-efflux system protein KefC [Usitatibacter sp.]|jgi:glutathione-regulated potassium-efflux system ancillary protein KefC|nr:glutathione-regulated potassium-efflux system protein KefC [Usitatibacter sp.]